MSQYKFQLNLFSLTDGEGMCRRLETMAQKGWIPVRIGPYVWRYRREEPKNLRYHVAYFPKESVYDPEDSEEKRTYRQACEEMGWQYVSGYDCMQIFSTEDPAAVAPEADAATTLESVHSCFKKRERFLWFYAAALALLILGIAVITCITDPVEILSNGAWQLGVLSVLLCVLMIGFEAIRYGMWLKKARQQVAAEGSFQGLKSMLPWEIIVVVLALGLFGWRLWIQDAYSRLVSIADLISYVVIFAAAAITRRIKRRENTQRRDVFLTTVTVVLLVALAMGMVQDLLLKNFRPQLAESDMLLSICALTGEEEKSVYRSEEIQKSLFLEDMTQYQAVNDQTEDAPIMQYRITKIKTPWLTEMCRENCLPARFHSTLDPQPAADWGAEIVWMEQTKSGRDIYYLYYADRTVTLMVNWELTAAQIGMLSAMFQSV